MPKERAKVIYRNYNPAALESAVNAVKTKKMSFRQASISFQVPIATIYNHAVGVTRSKIPQEIEKQVAQELIEKSQSTGNKISRPDIMSSITQVCDDQGVIIPFKDGVPSATWFRWFFHRHREIIPHLLKDDIEMDLSNDESSHESEWQPPSEADMKILQARRERSDKISKLMGDYLLKGYKMLSTSCPDCGCIFLQDKFGKDYCVACCELDSDTDKDDPALSSEAARRQLEEERERQISGDEKQSEAGSLDLTIVKTESVSPDTVVVEETPIPTPVTLATQCATTTQQVIIHTATPHTGFPANSTRSNTAKTQPRIAAKPVNQATAIVTTTGQPVGGVMPVIASVQHTGSLPLVQGVTGVPQYVHIAPAPTVQQVNPAMPTVNKSQSQHRDAVNTAFIGTQVSEVTELGQSVDVIKRKLQWATSMLDRTESIESSIQLCQLIKACAEGLVTLKTAQLYQNQV